MLSVFLDVGVPAVRILLQHTYSSCCGQGQHSYKHAAGSSILHSL
jgi:hypothetical protein